jgi:hypothetical protein
MGEAERFPIDTSQLMPRWFLVVWDAVTVFIAGIGTVGLALQLNPASLVFLAFGIFMIGVAHAMAQGLQDAGRNYAELSGGSLDICMYRPFKPTTVEFPYSSVERVDPHVSHRFPQGLFGLWPFYPRSEHVDVQLRRAQFLTPTWGSGILLWGKVLHLPIGEAERFAAALRERIAETAMSEPDGP